MMTIHKVNTRYINHDKSVIRNNEVYYIQDNNILANLTLSKTTLHPNKHTKGHKHDGLDEVYHFISGNGIMRINDDFTIVEPGDIILVPGGDFHQVINSSSSSSMEFICIFQKYDRDENTASYTKE